MRHSDKPQKRNEMMSHSDGPRNGWRQVMASVVAAGGVLWPAPPAAAQDGGAHAATYEVTFQGNWTLESTPGGVVGGAHFTTLIGAAHNDDVTFWQSGGRATPGVEQVAETGFTSGFRSELEASPHAAAVISESVTFGGTGSATFPIDVTRDHPLVTLLSMIGPSPDWFVGINGRSLLDTSDQWEPRVQIDLFPYDAGTEEGEEFSLDNPATDPPGVITRIAGTGKFSNEPMARLTFVLTETPPAVSLTASPNPVAEGVSVTVTATLSQALADDVTIPLTLTPGSAEAGDYGSLAGVTIDAGSTTGTGKVTTADDADADDETFTVALGSLPASVAQGTPSSVDVTISDDDVAAPAPRRPGPIDVAPGDGMLQVSWEPVPDAEDYTVQWSSGSEEYSDARQRTVQTPMATLSGLTNGVVYMVRVRASNAGGDGDWSEEATGTPLEPVPALPAVGAGLLGLLLGLLGGRQGVRGRGSD